MNERRARERKGGASGGELKQSSREGGGDGEEKIFREDLRDEEGGVGETVKKKNGAERRRDRCSALG